MHDLPDANVIVEQHSSFIEERQFDEDRKLAGNTSLDCLCPKCGRISDRIKVSKIPETGFFRLTQIIGNPKADPPIPALIPVSASTWWDGVAAGKYPQGCKLSSRTTAWRVEDILRLIKELSAAS